MNSKADLYRQRATQFEGMARDADPEGKAVYRELAAKYRQLAVYIESGSRGKLPSREDLN